MKTATKVKMEITVQRLKPWEKCRARENAIESSFLG